MEDEIHFVITCRKRSTPRTALFLAAYKYVEGLAGLSETNRFTPLLSRENEEVVFALARYCYLAFKGKVIIIK